MSDSLAKFAASLGASVMKSKSKMKIETQDYSYSCGDGCCYNYGTILFIDGKQIENREFSSSGDAYEYVLTEILGYEVDYMEGDHEE